MYINFLSPGVKEFILTHSNIQFVSVLAHYVFKNKNEI